MARNSRLGFGLVLVFKGVMPLNCLPYQIKRYPVVHLVFWLNTPPTKCQIFFPWGNTIQELFYEKNCICYENRHKQSSDVGIPPFYGFLCVFWPKWQLSFRNKHTEHFLVGNCDAGQNPINKYIHFDYKSLLKELSCEADRLKCVCLMLLLLQCTHKHFSIGMSNASCRENGIF